MFVLQGATRCGYRANLPIFHSNRLSSHGFFAGERRGFSNVMLAELAALMLSVTRLKRAKIVSKPWCTSAFPVHA